MIVPLLLLQHAAAVNFQSVHWKLKLHLEIVPALTFGAGMASYQSLSSPLTLVPVAYQLPLNHPKGL